MKRGSGKQPRAHSTVLEYQKTDLKFGISGVDPVLDGQRGCNVSAERVETLDSLPFETGFSKKAFGTLLCGTLAVVDSLPAPLHNQSSVSAVPEKTAQLNISPAYYICLATAALCFNFFPGKCYLSPSIMALRNIRKRSPKLE
ncbi:hypothetical protein DdX_08670 [Ditylenchus destructor]|uniref:Uncharacterized protein n=1 Tax=Ditylenchus destructor TaxID=166010 RepID=A0AAD4N5V1_9BILA|nr:hypothetical protein DdX_08670 [Ditylenchus destructor]